MAKTRIKNTPTRMQKDAIMGSTTVTTATTVYKSGRGGPEDTLKKRLLQLSQKNTNTTTIDLTASDSTIIVHAPKRTNSISSATSTLSHISDGGQSDSEFISLASPTPPITTPSPPRSARAATSNAMSLTPPSTIIDAMEETELKSEEPTMDELTENAIKTLNAGLQSRVMNGRSALAAAIKNRKVFMITEKNDHANHLNADSHGYNMQKRKMYLIMEENHDNDNDHHQQSNQEKWLKMDNGNAANAKSIGNCKKLTLFADKCDGQLPQQIEKILPEILHRIQAKNHDNSIIVSPNHLANTNAPTNTNLFTTKANATDRICAMGNLNTNANVNTISAGIDRTIINTDSNDSDEILFNHEMNHFNHQSIVKHDNHDDSKFIIFKTENNSDTNNTNNNNNNNNERLPLTLPPKKNRNKIINTQIIPVVMPQQQQQQQQQQHQHQHQNTDTNNRNNNFIRIENTNNFNHTNNKNNGVTNSVIYENLNGAAMTTITAAPPTVQPTAAGVTVVKTLPRIFRNSEDELNILTEEIMGATPVIVAPKQLQQQQQQQQQRQPCKTIGPSIKALPITAITAAPTTPTTAIKPINIELYNGNNNGTLTNVRNAERMPSHKNINLSPDFLFLMKMLPKLESVPEPQKTHLKNCIEQIITQNSNKFGCDE